jgi:hypothetical protein
LTLSSIAVHEGIKWPYSRKTCSAILAETARTTHGKSHFATALASEAVRAGKLVYFVALADFVAQRPFRIAPNPAARPPIG